MNKIIKEYKEYLNDKFWKWFGKSKMVDDKGNPEIYYHGVGKLGKFDTFREDLIGATSGNYGHFGIGFYFTTYKGFAENFSIMYGGTGEVIPAYLKIENPFYVNEKNLIFIGEKYDLNLPEKKPLSINKEKILKQLKNIDELGYNLLLLILDKGISEGWEIFLEKYPNYNDSKLDLNDISEWIEYFEPEKYRVVPNWLKDELNRYGFKDYLEYEYEENIRMDYLTELGNYANDWTDAIKKEGHDGIDAGEEVVVFKSNQIKSAENNNGNFNINSNNIFENENI